MEHLNNAMRMLAMLDRPAFMVAEGKILHANPLAEALSIHKDSALDTLLANTKEIYDSFTDGVLQITIWLQGKPVGATVEKMDGYDLFLLDSPQQDKQLEVLATASTQLRTHLTGLMNNMSGNSPQVNRTLCQLHRAISNMSDASRYSTDRTAQMQVFEICSWLGELAESVSVHAESLGIGLQYKPAPGPLYCPIDEELLRRAILNLISNSIQAGSTQLELSISKQPKTLSITLTDNGKGVAEDLRADIFCRYKQPPAMLNCSYGLGLGMAIVKAAAQTHKGTVLLEHKAEGGLRATLTLSTEQKQTLLRSPIMRIEYLGGRDTVLTELSDVLPPDEYRTTSRP